MDLRVKVKEMHRFGLGALLCVAAAAGVAEPAEAAGFLISGGTPTSNVPEGLSGHSVLGQAGIGFAGGNIWVDATLRNEGAIALTVFDVGSESAWKDQIRLLNSTTGTSVTDSDDHLAGTTGIFVNGSAPFQTVASITQATGVTNLRFFRVQPDPDVRLVVNGKSPSAVEGSGNASLAFAYLDETYQIVSGPTNRILVLLEDGSGGDPDYDDYVGILEGPPVEPPPPPPEPVLSISGGTQVGTIPQGNSGNPVLAQAGVGIAGGQIWLDGTLDVLGSGATLTLYDVGSESHWINEIRLGNSAGSVLSDLDDHFRGTTGSFTNGPAPFQLAGTVTQGSGVADFEFRRIDPIPEYQIVVNGQSPMMMVPEYGFASIALAYLDGANQVVSGPTNRVLVLLEDGGTDRDYDDYVGIVEANKTPLPYPVSPNSLAFGDVPRNTSSSPMVVTITNSGSKSLAIGTIKLSGATPKQFAKSSQCPSNLPSGASCTVSVVFTPLYPNTAYATLDLKVGGSVKVVGLFGRGI
jgi:hypothetical protein